MYILLPLTGTTPIAVVPEISYEPMKKTWVSEISTWDAPCIEDDGISLLVDRIGSLDKKFGNLGITMGLESNLRMPYGDAVKTFTSISEKYNMEVTDASPIIRDLRIIKSEAEI